MAPGEILAGKYEILKRLGEGGSGEVYLVMDTRLRKNWALKAVRTQEGKTDPVTQRTLFVEVGMLKNLSHPRLPRIVDAFDEGGIFCVVMDFIEGMTLRKVLEEEGPQKEEDVVRWALMLTDVLAYLHSRNPPVIYRDMKPGNIMLRPSGDVVLFDFGIARERKTESGEDTVSLGTPGYAAPEQLEGRGQTDARTDLYSLGVTMYQLLTGIGPGDPPYEMLPLRKIRPSLSKGMEHIVAVCTKRDPEERYRSCSELQDALLHIRDMDEGFLRREKKKLTAFAIALCTGFAGTALALTGQAGLRNERSARYLHLLEEAETYAEDLKNDGTFSDLALQRYVRAGDMIPSREDAWLRLLDYCAEHGCTRKGLAAVCARVDAGEGGIDRCVGVLFRIGELYFGGNERDSSFTGDYRRAAHYFAMIDRREMPEAVYYAALAEAMGMKGGSTDFRYISEMLQHFTEYNRTLPAGTRKIRNAMMAAGVYLANRHLFGTGETDAYALGKQLLQEAERDTSDLLAEASAGVSASDREGVLRELERRLLRRLGSVTAAGCAGKRDTERSAEAVGWYEKLLLYTEDEEEQMEIRFRIADAVELGGNEERTREVREELIALYPDSAKARLDYAAYLAGAGCGQEAAQMLRQAENCPDIADAPSYRSLALRLAGMNAE